MISSLNSGPGVTVSGGENGPYIDPNRASAGMMRYHGNTIEVYDGNMWRPVGSHAQVQLDHETQRVVDWARRKMREDDELKTRMAQHPGLRDAYERFKVMDTLTLEQQHDHHGEVQAGP